MKLELKHLSPYLPYGLKGEITRNIYPRSKEIKEVTITNISDWNTRAYSIKPILRPLSELFEDKYKNLFFISDYTYAILRKVQDGNKYNEVEALPYFVTVKLLENHFDVFGLIEKGLAIDINILTA